MWSFIILFNKMMIVSIEFRNPSHLECQQRVLPGTVAATIASATVTAPAVGTTTATATTTGFIGTSRAVRTAATSNATATPSSL